MSYCFDRVETPKPLTGYIGQHVKQAPLIKSNSILILVNANAFTYDSTGDIVNLNWPTTTKALNQYDSSIIKTLLNGNYAMVCGSKLFSMFDDNGSSSPNTMAKKHMRQSINVH